MSVFDKRVAFKPFEYDIVGFADAVNESFWTTRELDFMSDVHDFKVKLSEKEKNAIKNAILAIAQIEVKVKKFWADIGNVFPKAEFDIVGITFAESEIRHMRGYSHLLEVLGLNDEFNKLLDNPIIEGRVNYLTKYLKREADNGNEGYTLTLTLFSIFIENVSLFSQFLVIKSFSKHTQTLKDIDNIIQWTMKEEILHAMFGMHVINLIKKEFPEWFNSHFYDKLNKACLKAYEAEAVIIDWIFEKGDLPFLAADTVKEFVKKRFNDSLKEIGGEKVFDIDTDKIKSLQWFQDEIDLDVSTDFFHKKSPNYTKGAQPITADDLFD